MATYQNNIKQTEDRLNIGNCDLSGFKIKAGHLILLKLIYLFLYIF